MTSPISSRLQSLLHELNWSQTRLAEEAKTHPPTVNRWITGKTRPSRRTLARIAEITGCNLGWLEDGKGEMFSNMARKERPTWQSIGKQLHDDRLKKEQQRNAESLAKAKVVLEAYFGFNSTLTDVIDALYQATKARESSVVNFNKEQAAPKKKES